LRSLAVGFGFLLVFVSLRYAFCQDDISKRLDALERRLREQEEIIRRQQQVINDLRRQIESAKQQRTAARKEEIRRVVDEYIRSTKGSEVNLNLQTGYRAGHGFFLKTPDDEFELNIGGRVDFDALSYEGGGIEPWAGSTVNPPTPGGDMSSTFRVRRARIITSGHIWRHLKFEVEADFLSSPILKDGYVEFDYVPWLKPRFGLFKVPVGRERLMSTKYISFIERSRANDLLTPERDVGMMIHGRLFNGVLAYQTGIFNGLFHNPAHTDDNDCKDWAYRLVLAPWRNSRSEWLRGLEFGHGFQIGHHPNRGSRVRGRTASGIDFYNPGRNIPVRGRRTILSADVAWYKGPFSIISEWIHLEEERDGLRYVWFPGQTGDLDSIKHDGWYIEGSWLLTGEEKRAGMITPKRNFDPLKSGWGAWELAARYEFYKVNSRDPLFSYTDALNETHILSHQGVRTFTLGLNWYLNPTTRVMFNWVHDKFDEPLGGEEEADSFLSRLQVWW